LSIFNCTITSADNDVIQLTEQITGPIHLVKEISLCHQNCATRRRQVSKTNGFTALINFPKPDDVYVGFLFVYLFASLFGDPGI
jgi:hypothetical protein